MTNLEDGVMGIDPHQPGELAAEFSVGIDIEEVERFSSVSDDATKRALFTPEELEYCSAFSGRRGSLRGHLVRQGGGGERRFTAMGAARAAARFRLPEAGRRAAPML